MIIRPEPFNKTETVRIIRDMNDSTLDQFVSIDVAIAMINDEQLREVDCGARYPHSFMYV